MISNLVFLMRKKKTKIVLLIINAMFVCMYVVIKNFKQNIDSFHYCGPRCFFLGSLLA